MSFSLPSSPAIERVLGKLKGVKGAGEGKWMALCPAHGDRQRSLSIRAGNDGRALMHCHAGCTVASVVAVVGLQMTDLFPDTARTNGAVNGSAPVIAPAQGVKTRQRMVKSFDYHDADGNVLFRVCRMEPKAFPQQRPTPSGGWEWGLGDIAPVLYRLPAIIEAVAAERRIYIAEGEKDVDAMVDLGLSATTSPMGAGKWRDAYAEVLAGADVVVFPDNDEPGHLHAQDIADSLKAQGCTVRVVPLPDLALKGDVSDWLANGGTLAKLEALVARTELWNIGDVVPPPLGAPRFKMLSVAELESLPPMEWLVGEEGAGVLPATALLSLFGAPGAGKSFLAADLACTIASRRVDLVPLWFGNAVQKRGPVLYVAAEGGRGFRHRVIAWRSFHNVPDQDLWLKFILEPANLHGPDDVSHILRAADALGQQYQEAPCLIVFDTLARCMVGGDENSAQDVGLVIDRAERIKRETGASVKLVHHTRKDGDVERGSGALRGGVDTLCLAREDEDGGRILSCEKQKDADPFDPITFYLRPVGDSCVVSEHAPATRAHALTANQRAALKTLSDLFHKGATTTEWRGGSGLAERTFYRVRAWLVSQGYVSETDRGNAVRYAIAPSGHWALHGDIGTLN